MRKLPPSQCQFLRRAFESAKVLGTRTYFCVCTLLERILRQLPRPNAYALLRNFQRTRETHKFTQFDVSNQLFFALQPFSWNSSDPQVATIFIFPPIIIFTWVSPKVQAILFLCRKAETFIDRACFRVNVRDNLQCFSSHHLPRRFRIRVMHFSGAATQKWTITMTKQYNQSFFFLKYTDVTAVT